MESSVCIGYKHAVEIPKVKLILPLLCSDVNNARFLVGANGKFFALRQAASCGIVFMHRKQILIKFCEKDLIFIKKSSVKFAHEAVIRFKELNLFSVLILKITYQLTIIFCLALALSNYFIFSTGHIILFDSISQSFKELVPAIAVTGVSLAFIGDMVIAKKD